MQPVAFAVVGVRNFAATHLKNIRRLAAEGGAQLAAVVIADQERNQAEMEALQAEGVTIFPSFAALLEGGSDSVDIITLPVTIPSHFSLALQAMEAGYNVVLEKPPVPTIEQMDRLREAERTTGKFCAVGFQFIHARSIRRLKEVLLSGKLGTIKDMACKGYWPRDVNYYSRNAWAGRSVLEGQLVLDGPMHNALAHFLNNMLFLSGPDMQNSAELKTVRAELYRSRSFITSDDTTCFQGATTTGVNICFYVTHSPSEQVDPYLEIRGTEGTAIWTFKEQVTIKTNAGEAMTFDNEGVDPWVEVMRTAARVHTGELPQLYCTLDNTRSFVVAINGAYQSARQIVNIPDEYLIHHGEGGSARVEVKDINGLMDKAFAARSLLSDVGVPWAVASKPFDVTDFTSFDPFAPLP